MDYAGAIEFIKQRMREMDVPENRYHYEPVYIVPENKAIGSNVIEIKAYNEFYYLVNEWDVWGVEIISDTGHFHSAKPEQNTVPEFSGHIIIKEVGAGWQLGKTFVDGAFTRTAMLVFVRVIIY